MIYYNEIQPINLLFLFYSIADQGVPVQEWQAHEEKPPRHKNLSF